MPEPFVFTRIYPPRPVGIADLEQLVRRLASTDVPRPLALELRADDEGVRHVLGCAPTAVHQLKRLIRTELPGVAFAAAIRTPVTSAGRVSATQKGLPLGTPDPERIVLGIYGALDSRKPGETLVLQSVFGRTRSPEFVGDALDPLQGTADRLWRGGRNAPTQTRRRLADHAADLRVELTMRIGVDGPDPGRRRALALEAFGALRPLESVGVKLRLVREPAARLHAAVIGRPGLHLTPQEAAPLIGWPMGERDYPGIDPMRPKRLAVPAAVTDRDAVFAVGTAPGLEKRVGITASARLSHLGVLSPTGSGKSESVLLPLLLADVRAGRPVCLVDPKGQLVDYVLDALEPEDADRVVVFDPSDPEGTAGFSPLDIGTRDPYAAVDGIMAVFKAVFASGWGPRTEDILHSSLLTLALDGTRAGKPHTLLDVPRLLTDDAFRRSAVSATKDEPELARFWGRYESMTPQQREHEIAAPMNKLRRYLTRRGVTSVLGQGAPPFRLRDIWKGDAIVLVSVNESLAGTETSRLIGGLICAEVFAAAQERAQERNPKKRPGFVYVDEVARFMHLPVPLSTALEVSRSYGVGWALFGQGNYQLSAELAEAMEINTRSKVTFATSPKEARLIARQAPALDAEDIQLLPQYEAYATVMTDSGSSGWFSIRTLPPPVRLGHGDTIRQASRTRNHRPVASRAAVDEPAADAAPVTSGHMKRRRQ